MGKDKPRTALDAALLKRKYVHFDAPLTRNECRDLVTSPAAVGTHAFFPFLRHDLVRRKLKRSGKGRVTKSLKIRDIRYAAHADAAIYSYYNFLLCELYEKKVIELGLSDNVTAFRSLAKSNVDFANEAFEWIATNRPCNAFGFDVTDFFGSLNHTTLKKAWSSLLGLSSMPEDHFSVFRSLTKHSSVELIAARRALGLSRSSLARIDRLCSAAEFRTKIRGGGLVFSNKLNSGIPQGSPISAALSNIYMLEFDKNLKKQVERAGGVYRRYCDDILVLVPNLATEDFEDLVAKELSKLGLSMQTAKTLSCKFDKQGTKTTPPLQYLGLTYDGASVLLRSSGISRFYLKMRRGVAQLKTSKRTDGSTALIVQRRRTLLNKYSEHTPATGRSYFKYVRLATKKTNSTSIKRQLKRHRRRLADLM